MFSVMWSEHCSYKSSRPLLATLPTTGPDVVAGPGENAGVQRIGDGPGGRLQDGVAQPPVGRRAVPGCRDRGRGDPPRHLRDGRPPDRRPRRPPLRRTGRSPDPPPRRRRRRRGGGLRQLRRRPDRRRRAHLRPLVPGQSARQRHGDRDRPRGRDHAGRGAGTREPRRPLRQHDRPGRDRRRVGPRQRDLRRPGSLEAARRPGRRPVRGEAPHRGDPRDHRAPASPKGSRTSAPPASPAASARRPTGPGRGSSSTSTRSRAASPAWSRSR